MKKQFSIAAIIIIIAIILSIIFIFLFNKKNTIKLLSPLAADSAKENARVLDKYSFEVLRNRNFLGSQIKLDKVINNDAHFTSYIFFLNSDGKKVSGLANIPNKKEKAPVIIMIRGYIDREKYKTGAGTKNMGQLLAKNGFLTLAPDFLGYGASDMPSSNPIEERFEKYTTLLNLIASVKSLPQADSDNIGIWGHSNGGHIALAILEITEKPYPTVLWAPVSKPFPYSILYYTDEFEDYGKALRKLVAQFEKDYDVDKYSIVNYFNKINKKTLIQLHQGGSDEAVPQKWSDQLYETLSGLKLTIEYFTYPGEDHNFTRGSTSPAASRTVLFFKLSLIN